MTLKDKSLALAIAVSAVWHLLWISMIKVVIVPDRAAAVKFSKISFLGPVISTKALEVRMETRPKSFLEKRFSVYADSLFPKVTARRDDDFSKDFYYPKADALAALLEESISGTKSFPPPSHE